jgi:hypothetical protein
MLDHENTVTQVIDSVAMQMGALEMRNSVLAGVLGKEVAFGSLVASGGTLSTKGAPDKAQVPFGLRLEAGLSGDGSDTASLGGLIVGAALTPGISLGAHFSRASGATPRIAFASPTPMTPTVAMSAAATATTVSAGNSPRRRAMALPGSPARAPCSTPRRAAAARAWAASWPVSRSLMPIQ